MSAGSQFVPRIRRMRAFALAAIALAVALSASCGEYTPGPPGVPRPPRPGPISDVAELYLEQVLDSMEDWSIYTDRVDWRDFRAGVLAAAGGAQTIQDTYPAIEHALFTFNDPHSAYVTSGGVMISYGAVLCRRGSLDMPLIPDNVGYVRVGAFTGRREQARLYAEAIQTKIRMADREDLVGWIVDLRGNSGGNMWPMIAGVGPILGEGTLGYFIDPDGEETPWGYTAGTAWVRDGLVRVSLDTPYHLLQENPKVALLIDNFVSSSGETILLSFTGRPNTRSFGEETCGLATSRGGWSLWDGGRLYLSTYGLADREMFIYEGPIAPDESMPDTAAAAERAIEWLLDGARSGS